MSSFTAYQLSKELKANYRTISRILREYADKGLVEIDGTDIKSKATVYSISDDVLGTIASRVQEICKKNATVCNSDYERNLTRLQDLHLQVCKQADTIKSLNDLISAKDKEIQALTNKNVVVDSELKQAQTRLLFIEDKSKSVESENAKLNQDLEKLQKSLKARSAIIIGLSAVLLVGVTIVAMMFISQLGRF